MNAQVFDVAKELDEKHFIHQTGSELNELKGPLKLSLENIIAVPNVVHGADGKLYQSDALLVRLHMLDINLDEKNKLLASSLRQEVVRLSESILHESSDRISAAAIESHLEKKKSFFMRGKWVGDDIGDSQNPIINIFSKGQHIGLRLENLSGLPEHSGKNVGRVLYNTIDEKIYCDVGYKLKAMSAQKFEKDIQISDTSEKIIIDLSDSDIDDARKALWQVCLNSSDFQRLDCLIKTPDHKTVIIELPMGSEAGSYRLLGVE